jgi:hypothetical protein
VHVTNEAEVILIARCLADSLAPLLDRLQNAVLDPRGPYGWSLGEPADQFIQEFLRADLEMERISAILDGNIE